MKSAFEKADLLALLVAIFIIITVATITTLSAWYVVDCWYYSKSRPSSERGDFITACLLMLLPGAIWLIVLCLVRIYTVSQ